LHHELDWLEQRVGEAASRRDFALRIAGLAMDDQRMHDAFEILKKELSTDGEWVRFVSASYSSMQDYNEFRERRGRAQNLLRKVGNDASTLARTFRQLQETGVMLSPELRDNRREFFVDTRISRVAEDLLIRKIAAIAHDAACHTPAAPDLSDLLRQAAITSRATEAYFGFEGVDAAISKQKRNLKTEYIRALGVALTSPTAIGDPVSLTAGVRCAMAITGTVAINSEAVVTEDDVRKAIATKHFRKRRASPAGGRF
jgi:hypothetical protein